jgi:hypothetical protein
MMGKHSKDGQPATGNGRTGGKKPAKAQITQKTSGGATLWKATARLWGAKKK